MALFDFLTGRKPKDEPASPVVGGYGGGKKTLASYENSIAADNAMQHPVVMRCLHKIASSVQSVRWYATEDESLPSSERAGARDVARMNRLLAEPNDNMAPDQLRYWMALNFACYGRIPMKIGTGLENFPNGIYPLSVRYVTAETDARGKIVYYDYGFGEQSERLPTRRRANGKPYCYEIYTPNIHGTLDMGCNVTPLRAIGLPSAVVRLLLQRASDTAAGHPNSKYIITAEKTLTSQQKEAVRDYLEDTKPEGLGTGEPLFLNGTKVEVHKLDNDLSDIHSKMPSDDMARMIYGAFGIPVALMGIGAADSAKFTGNYAESRAAFWEDTIIPSYLSPIAVGLTQALCNPGMVIKFDEDSIPALSYARVLRAKELSSVTFLSMEEKREQAGYEQEFPAGQVPDKPPVATPTPPTTNSGAE